MVNQLPDAPALDVLADPTRRAVLTLLAVRPRAAGELAASCRISKPALSRHLRLLRARRVVEEFRIREDGRVRMYRLRREPLDEVARWTAGLQAFWAHQLAAYAEVVRREARGLKSRRRRSRGDATRRRQRHG